MRISDWSSDVCSSDLIVVEKEFPFSISLYTLPAADIERGKVQMRMAIRRFADCLAADHWPAYADEPTEVGLHFAAFYYEGIEAIYGHRQMIDRKSTRLNSSH